MHSSKYFSSRAGFVILAGLGIAALLPSCAFKRFTDWDQNEEAAANAESLEDALAILDQAIEETAPASEIASIPLNIPAHPEGLLGGSEETEPVVTSVGLDEFDMDMSETLFEIAVDDTMDDATVVNATVVNARAEEAAPGAEELEEEAAEAAEASLVGLGAFEKSRERIVVNRPAPKYGTDTQTTAVFDEFRIVRTTAYSHTEEDHIQYGELSAMGKPLRFGMVRSAAADWSRYPVGTRFRIVGKPYEYVVDDYGSALVGTDTIDLYKPSTERMDDWGAREVEIEVIAWGSFGKSVEILEPRRKYGEHVTQMIDSITGRAEATEVLATAIDDASIRSHD